MSRDRSRLFEQWTLSFHGFGSRPFLSFSDHKVLTTLRELGRLESSLNHITAGHSGQFAIETGFRGTGGVDYPNCTTDRDPEDPMLLSVDAFRDGALRNMGHTGLRPALG